jgi:hypothetical protein
MKRLLALLAIAMMVVKVLSAETNRPIYVAVGLGSVRLFSPDGMTWEQAEQSAHLGSTPGEEVTAGLAYANGRFVAVGGDFLTAAAELTLSPLAGSPKGGVIVSTDGRKWRQVATYPGRVSGVTYANGRFIALGPKNQFIWSTDGENWKPGGRINFNGTLKANQAAYGRGMVVFVGNGIAKRNDTVQTIGWTAITKDGEVIQDFQTIGNHALTGVAYGLGSFVTAGEASYVASSQDGHHWKTEILPPENYFTSVIWTGREFLITGSKGNYRSKGGSVWLPYTDSQLPLSLLYADDRIWIGQHGLHPWFSTNGVNWHNAKSTNQLVMTHVKSSYQQPIAGIKQPGK